MTESQPTIKWVKIGGDVEPELVDPRQWAGHVLNISNWFAVGDNDATGTILTDYTVAIGERITVMSVFAIHFTSTAIFRIADTVLGTVAQIAASDGRHHLDIWDSDPFHGSIGFSGGPAICVDNKTGTTPRHISLMVNAFYAGVQVNTPGDNFGGGWKAYVD